MNSINRRSFLQLSTKLGLVFGLGASAIPRLAKGLEELSQGTAPVLWLQGQCCSGCSVSLLDSEAIRPVKLLTSYISLGFHQTLSAATGHQAVETVNQIINRGDFILAVEGTVPAGMPEACMFGDEIFGDQLVRAAKKAKAVLAVGTCASFGGIPAAENNPTGATCIPAFFKQQGIGTATIRIPGCPSHPDWLVGVIAHTLKIGIPALDELGRPLAYFAKSMHDQCPRFTDYEREHFARTFGEDGCLFKLGCAGPITKTDCNLRSWNGGVNSCIRAGAPCVGCGGENFAAKTGFAMITKQRAAGEKS